jgi:ATP/maltotriose-dependent transcriptional regulator MalT
LLQFAEAFQAELALRQGQLAKTEKWGDNFLDESLSQHELEILTLLVQRLSNKEIVEQLFISPDTIKKHLYNVYQKLNVSTRRQAIDKANALGIL